MLTLMNATNNVMHLMCVSMRGGMRVPGVIVFIYLN